MPKTFIGTNQIKKAFVGTSQVKKIWVGQDLVYNSELYLMKDGTAQTGFSFGNWGGKGFNSSYPYGETFHTFARDSAEKAFHLIQYSSASYPYSACMGTDTKLNLASSEYSSFDKINFVIKPVHLGNITVGISNWESTYGSQDLTSSATVSGEGDYRTVSVDINQASRGNKYIVLWAYSGANMHTELYVKDIYLS